MKKLFNIFYKKKFIIGQKNSTEINSGHLYSLNLSNGTKKRVKKHWNTRNLNTTNKTNKQPSFIDKDKCAPCAL
jgi:hypothetical protein